jgi:hypothetical protein
MGIKTEIVSFPAGLIHTESEIIQQGLKQAGKYPRSYRLIHVKELTADESKTSDKKSEVEEKCEVHYETIKVGVQGLFEEGMSLSVVLSIVSQIVVNEWSKGMEELFSKFKRI